KDALRDDHGGTLRLCRGHGGVDIGHAEEELNERRRAGRRGPDAAWRAALTAVHRAIAESVRAIDLPAEDPGEERGPTRGIALHDLPLHHRGRHRVLLNSHRVRADI